MTQQEFNKLSRKYLDGQTTPAEEERLMAWYERQPPPPPAGLTEQERQGLERRLWQKLHRKIQPVSRDFLIHRWTWVVGLAACLLLVLGGLLYKQTNSSTSAVIVRQAEATPPGLEIRNTTAVEQVVRLKDGSTVWLKPASSVICDRAFNQRSRTVYLQGEAFFAVKRNTTRPFVVHAGGLVTEVLGTSFRIRPRARQIEVVVQTGRVSVYTQQVGRRAERAGVILTPNQRATFDIASQTIVPTLVEQPAPLPSAVAAPPNLVFQSTPLANVLKTLTEIYGIEFVLVTPTAATCQITADLTGLPLFTQIDLICKSIDATYEKRGTVVFIAGDGCY